jgi:regulator of RNase E activity RraA
MPADFDRWRMLAEVDLTPATRADCGFVDKIAADIAKYRSGAGCVIDGVIRWRSVTRLRVYQRV